MKKKIAMFLTLVMVGSLVTGCGGGSTDSAAAESGNGEQITLRLSNMQSLDNPANIACENIAAKVLEETDGRIKIDVYPASQLGDWTSVYDEVMMGSIDMCLSGSPETYNAKAGSYLFPNLVSTYDEIDDVYGPGSYLYEQMEQVQSEVGIKFMGFWCEGFGGIGTTKPVTDPAAVTGDKGVLIRVPAMEVNRLPMEYRGYRTASIPYSDVFVSMQTGVVDGWFGGTPYLTYSSFRDVLKHYYFDHNFIETSQFLINDNVFNSLSEEDQEILTRVIQEELATCSAIAEQSDAENLELLKDAGIEVVTFTDEELDAMATGVRENVWPEFADVYGQDFVDGLIASYE